jgi:hypothetical protein
VAQGRWRDMVQVFAEASQRLPEPAGRERAAQAEEFHVLLIRECDALFERWHALRAEERAAAAAGGETRES